MTFSSNTTTVSDRSREWFVPGFGPQRFRILAGLLFLPYTGMVISFAVMGSMAAPSVVWTRVGAIAAIYMLGLGVGAHALDALGSKSVRPWGRVFSNAQLKLLAAVSLTAAYGIAFVFIFGDTPWLSVVAVLEGFFVFAYNLEWFGGKFHTDGWFSFSWGFLPVLAGCLIQANTVPADGWILAAAAALLSQVEIKVSRPYKELKRSRTGAPDSNDLLAARYEMILKSISLGVILMGLALSLQRLRIG